MLPNAERLKTNARVLQVIRGLQQLNVVQHKPGDAASILSRYGELYDLMLMLGPSQQVLISVTNCLNKLNKYRENLIVTELDKSFNVELRREIEAEHKELLRLFELVSGKLEPEWVPPHVTVSLPTPNHAKALEALEKLVSDALWQNKYQLSDDQIRDYGDLIRKALGEAPPQATPSNVTNKEWADEDDDEPDQYMLLRRS
jgi:hypothetical protein